MTRLGETHVGIEFCKERNLDKFYKICIDNIN